MPRSRSKNETCQTFKQQLLGCLDLSQQGFGVLCYSDTTAARKGILLVRMHAVVFMRSRCVLHGALDARHMQGLHGHMVFPFRLPCSAR